MTSSLHREKGPRPPRHTAAARAGFTLIEMLVVMGIILLLISILLPAINRAYQQSVRNSMAADLQVISQALEAYKNDFGDYPRPSVAVPGAVILCWALIAPGPASQDGAGQMNGSVVASPDNGAPGFRLRATGQGKIYGPYLPVDRFALGFSNNVGLVTPITTGVISDLNTVIADRYGHAILYFPANRSISPTVSYLNTGPIGATPPTTMYNYSDNAAYLNTGTPATCSLTLHAMRYKMGDTTPVDGKITGAEIAATTSPYILWSAGPDGKFGPPLDPVTGLTNATDDDVIYPVINDIPAGFKP